jgi:hypothetical protein
MLGYPPWTYQLEISKKWVLRGIMYMIYMYKYIDSLWLINRAMENGPLIEDI